LATDDVDAAEVPGRLRRGTAQGLCVGDVGGDRQRAVAERRCGLLHCLTGQVDERDVVTLCDELAGGLLADPAGGTGDEDRLLARLPRARGTHAAAASLFVAYNQLKPSTRTPRTRF
jgi:hypothetical protein